MEVFGFELRMFIFEIFLPLLLFYLLLFIFLKKSKIFGDVSNTYYSLTALTISLISILSLYSLGLTRILPYLAASLTVLSFVAIYLYGVFRYSTKVVSREKNVSEWREEIEEMINKIEAEKNEEKKKEYKEALKKRIEEIEKEARKINFNLEQEEWFKKAKEVVK